MENGERENGFVETAIRVRYAETDQMGVVYYANYLVWFEVGRNAWCHAQGFSYREMEEKHDRMLIVAEATCRYHAPARYEDEILIRTSVSAVSPKVIRFHYELLHKESGETVASGETIHVITDRNLRSARLPKCYHRHFGLPAG